MNINFAFRGFEENSNALKDYASKRLSKVDKLVPASALVDIVFQKDKNLKLTEIKVNVDGSDFIATESDDKEFSASIDLCVDKITKQIIKSKGKKIDSRRP